MTLKAKELARLLDMWDPEMEVAIRLNLSDALDHLEDLDGEYLDIYDDRSVLVENGKVVIIADVMDD